MKDRYKFLILFGAFLGAYFIPFESLDVQKAILESFYMLQDYAQKHVLLCLVPAFFIAGAISVFVSQAAVMKYLGPAANKCLSYSVASVSGTVLLSVPVLCCPSLPASTVWAQELDRRRHFSILAPQSMCWPSSSLPKYLVGR